MCVIKCKIFFRERVSSIIYDGSKQAFMDELMGVNKSELHCVRRS